MRRRSADADDLSTPLLVGFDDLPAEDLSIAAPSEVPALVQVLPDEVFEALDLSRLSEQQRNRVLQRVVEAIAAA